MSADTGLAARMRGRWDIVLLIILVAIALGLFAAIAERDATRPVGFAASPLPTVTPQSASAEGWWASVPVTATPSLPGLPGLPKVGLGGAGLQAGAPVPFQITSCPTGGVAISAITTAKPGWWNITGSAEIPNLEYWKGEISADGKGWTMLYNSPRPVRDGVLIEFNTRTVPRGTYQVRLLAVDRTGNYPAPCVIQITTQ